MIKILGIARKLHIKLQNLKIFKYLKRIPIIYDLHILLQLLIEGKGEVSVPHLLFFLQKCVRH